MSANDFSFGQGISHITKRRKKQSHIWFQGFSFPPALTSAQKPHSCPAAFSLMGPPHTLTSRWSQRKTSRVLGLDCTLQSNTDRPPSEDSSANLDLHFGIMFLSKCWAAEIFAEIAHQYTVNAVVFCFFFWGGFTTTRNNAAQHN